MVDQMLSSFVSFTSHGSGWVLEKNICLNICIVSHLPVRGSCYNALPLQLQNMKFLLTVRNREDNNWFLYCYSEAGHYKYGPSLHENVSRHLRTSPETYKRTINLAHQPIGEFEMPMGFNQVPKFEKLHNVHVNIFQYRQNALLPLLNPKNTSFCFTLDLLLLIDGRTHQYVLIKDFKLFVSNIEGHVPR